MVDKKILEFLVIGAVVGLAFVFAIEPFLSNIGIFQPNLMGDIWRALVAGVSLAVTFLVFIWVRSFIFK